MSRLPTDMELDQEIAAVDLLVDMGWEPTGEAGEPAFGKIFHFSEEYNICGSISEETNGTVFHTTLHLRNRSSTQRSRERTFRLLQDVVSEFLSSTVMMDTEGREITFTIRYGLALDTEDRKFFPPDHLCTMYLRESLRAALLFSTITPHLLLFYAKKWDIVTLQARVYSDVDLLFQDAGNINPI